MATPSVSQVIERGFAAGVADRLARGPFTYTDRVTLMAAGRRLGIDPVRASLIIAEQHQAAAPPRRPLAALTAVAAVLAVQGSVVAAVAWACLA